LRRGNGRRRYAMSGYCNMSADPAKLQAIIGYAFNDKGLLHQALTHRSASRIGAPFSYERLEFLGDRVLGLVLAEALLRQYPAEKEGAIAKRHAALVRQEALVAVAERLHLMDYISTPSTDRTINAAAKASVQADVMEAILGAVYWDGGFAPAKDIVLRFWDEALTAVNAPPIDAKSALQEWAQGHGLPLPDYTLVDNQGPAHAPNFTVTVKVGKHPACTGSGTTHKAAQQAAATVALQQLGIWTA
jgi:ribonuclease-3